LEGAYMNSIIHDWGVVSWVLFKVILIIVLIFGTFFGLGAIGIKIAGAITDNFENKNTRFVVQFIAICFGFLFFTLAITLLSTVLTMEWGHF